ncbi:MAG: HeH/LEM domain-containing protein [Candidatus Thermoplasmatota archaeon]|nr:HeH/LEM domain-containing protein [Candidatus Thermoplasmatota archaeon]
MTKYRTPKRKLKRAPSPPVEPKPKAEVDIPLVETIVDQRTKAELKELLDAKQVPYPHNANKAMLIELVNKGGYDAETD